MFPEIKEIKEVTTFFERKDLPKTLRLSEYQNIINMKVFAENSIECIRHFYKKKQEPLFYNHYDLMIKVKTRLENEGLQ